MIRLLSNITVRTKLVLLLLIFGLLPLAIIMPIIHSQVSVVSDTTLKQQETLAQNINDVIDRNLFERYGDVQAFGLNTVTRDSEYWGSPYNGNPLIDAMNSYTVKYGLYKLMMLVGLDGKVLGVNSIDASGNPVSTQYLYGESFADASWFKKAKNGKFLKGELADGTAVEQPYFDTNVAKIHGDDGYVIPFSAPVLDANGRMFAIWVNFADFGLVDGIVQAAYAEQEKLGLGKTEITVLDPKGNIIVDIDPSVKGKDYQRDRTVIGKFNLAEKGVDAAIKAVSGQFFNRLCCLPDGAR